MTITEFLTARLDEESRFWANPSAMRFGGVGLSDLILRMRADVAAKRAIVAEYVREDAANFGDQYLDGLCSGLEQAVRHLASLYESHKDYDPAWRVG